MTTAETDLRERNKQVVRRFLGALEAMDVEGFLDLWAENGVQEMPFAPRGFPDRLDGKKAIRRQYGGLPEAYTRTAFPIADLQTMEDPTWVVAQYRGVIDGNTATCDSDVCATHFRPSGDGQEPVWQVGGFYRYRLVRSEDGWLVRTMRFVPIWSRGNPALSPTGAQVRAG